MKTVVKEVHLLPLYNYINLIISTFIYLYYVLLFLVFLFFIFCPEGKIHLFGRETSFVSMGEGSGGNILDSFYYRI